MQKRKGPGRVRNRLCSGMEGYRVYGLKSKTSEVETVVRSAREYVAAPKPRGSDWNLRSDASLGSKEVDECMIKRPTAEKQTQNSRRKVSARVRDGGDFTTNKVRVQCHQFRG